ncbi:MAG TPA: TrmJ/YjtD family RNA methyltransferase [Terriglobia bacterium]|nr:TrmJ/YjtD family RNA methyltransferase [Terriglobia bacterium]
MSWRIVLVRPRNPLNIGAAARAMANFGFDDLVVVAPFDPVWREARSAVGAGAVLESARVVEHLPEAIGDCSFVAGTTTGSRRNLDRNPVPLTELTSTPWKLPPRTRAAVLFGSEKTGLLNDHLSYCHQLVRIPTTKGCPSMNLGQAVAVCCYELARAAEFPRAAATGRVHSSSPANVQSMDHLLDRAAGVLDCAGYFKPKGRAAQLLKLRRLLLGLGLNNHDVRVLGGVLAQIEWKMKSGQRLVMNSPSTGGRGLD